MGRPRGFEEGVVLQCATEVFVRGGYEGTSIDDLVRALQLHRGSLYKAFGSKRGLFVAVLRHYVQVGLPEAIRRCCTGSADAADALAATSDLDLLLVAGLERGPVDAEIATLVRHALSTLDQALRGVQGPSQGGGSSRPTRALDLLGARLYERLRHDSTTPKPPKPPKPSKPSKPSKPTTTEEN